MVKIGTSTITEKGEISEARLASLVRDVISLITGGYQVVLVTSGAITAGSTELSRHGKGLSIPEKQAYAAVGQPILINEYRRHFQKAGLNVAQILLTDDDVKNRRRFLNARHTFNSLLHLGVVPIVNENDTVVVTEIKFGDNDTLSAHILGVVEAELLILLSDIDGYYWDLNDPCPVEEIRKITPEVFDRAGGAGTTYGTGGMFTKIRAAEMIMRFGEKMIIADGSEPHVLSRIMKGEKIGTLFVGEEHHLSSRKKWVAARKPRGTVTLDDGAVNAIVNNKRSLLATGVTAVSGVFDMGDSVELLDPSGHPVGRGIVNYNSMELDLIRGKKSSEIRSLLGIHYFDEVINRNDLIVY